MDHFLNQNYAMVNQVDDIDVAVGIVYPYMFLYVHACVWVCVYVIHTYIHTCIHIYSMLILYRLWSVNKVFTLKILR